MNDVQRIAEERAAQPRTKPIGSSMQSEHRIAKNAVVQQINALDGTRIQKIDAVDDRKQSDMPLLDTRKEHDLTGTLVADLVLQLLSYVAETERRFIKQRQAEGIAAAKARGVRFGHMPMEKPECYPAVLEVYNRGGISQRHAALLLGVSRFTFKKWVDQEDHDHEAAERHEQEMGADAEREKKLLEDV